MTSGENISSTDASVSDADPAAASNAGISDASAADVSASSASATTTATSGPGSEAPAAPKSKVGSGPLAARGLGLAKPASPTVDMSKLSGKDDSKKQTGNKKSRSAPRPKLAGDRRGGPKPATPVRDEAAPQNAASQNPAQGDATAKPGESTADNDAAGSGASDGSSANKPRSKPVRPGKVAVPSLRADLDDDLQAELDAAFGDGGDAMAASAVDTIPRKGEPLVDGARVHGVVLKIHDGSVYVSLGGPDEGSVPLEQFETEPTAGDSIEVMVRGTSADGLYQCSLPGGAIEVSDWDDLQEGSVVEATVTATNTGGLEAKVGGVSGFIPISQISEFRVEDTSEFVNQKFLCVVTEANPRRRNLVLSRRAILEREREEKKKEQLETIEQGDEMEGTVRSIKDFGAFVDLGALDGLIHISKLSWERVKHPSEVLEEGQKVKVRIDKLDKQTGKISLTYRDLLENPWDSAEAEFAPGTVHRGAVTKVAPFGCFVRLTAGVEGMVHISELASHRVSKVDAFVSEGDEVEVKVLSFDRDAQKISLSIKQASNAGAPEVQKAEDDLPPAEVSVKPQHAGPLKGGNNRDTGGERFGLRW